MDANTVAETVRDVILALIAGVPAILLAWAAYQKVKLTFVHITDLEDKVKKQGERITTLERENSELRKENAELREQNSVLAGINEDYRTKLLPALEHKPTQPRKS